MLSDIEDKAKEDTGSPFQGYFLKQCYPGRKIIQEGKYITRFNLPEGWYLNDMEAKPS